MSTNYIGTFGSGSRQETYEPSKFPSYQKSFFGSESEVRAIAVTYFNLGWKIVLVEGNPWQVTCTISRELSSSDSTTPIDTTGTYATKNFSLRYNIAEKEILHARADGTWLASINDKDKVALEKLISSPPKVTDSDGSDTITDAGINWNTSDSGSAFFNSTSTSVSASQVVWTMTTNGFKTIPIIQPVFHFSMTVSSGFNLTTFNNNISRVYSKATISSETGAGSNWQAIMPADTLTFAAIPCPNGSTIPYIYGWLKQPPSNDQNGATINVSVEWVYGLYPTNIYGTRL